MNDRTGLERPVLEVADIIRAQGEDFLSKYAARLTGVQRQALHDLSVCRTAALGGHVQRCLDCGHERCAYNSCRNRHCPKCQALARARWLEHEAASLLPVEYHHVVFTLPAAVAELALVNQRVLYDALFQAAAATLRDVAADPKWLGAQLGVLLVLHTWGQNLHHHPHVHGVVTGGGLACDAQGVLAEVPRWVSCRPGFLLPVRVLSRVFRGQYLELLRQAYAQGRLRFPGKLARLTEPGAFTRWLTPLYEQAWVVYAKAPFGGPAQVLKYLARYTHRVAISNSRLLSLEDGAVTFRYKDYADDHRSKALTLSAEEFLRRFVQHVLPKGFVKIRHYGLLANRHRAEKLPTCRRLLLPVSVLGGTAATAAESATGDWEPAARPQCARCGSHRLVCLPLPEAGGAARPTCGDSS